MSSLTKMTRGGSMIKEGTLEIGGEKKDMILFDMTEKAILKALEDIDQKEVDAFVQKLEIVSSKEIADFLASLFDFMGFDPRAVIKKLLVINDYYINEKKTKGETRDSLKFDVLMMIAANIIMGNLQDKSIGRRSVGGRMALGYLVQKYGIHVGSTGTGLPSDTLTFPRVANSFPVITCRAATVLPTKDFLGAPFKTKQLPKYMRVSAFASLCDEEMGEELQLFLLQAVCAYSCDQLITVHEGEKKKRKEKKDENILTPSDAYVQQWDYIVIAASSPVPTVEMKRATIAELLVENQYSVLSDIVLHFRKILSIGTEVMSETTFQDAVQKFVKGKGKGKKASE